MKTTETAPFQIYIPFFSDFGFKATFGNEHNPLFLKRALQALIQSSEPIDHVWFDKNTIEGQTVESRGGVLDIFCRDSTGNIFIVEMQLGKFPNMVQRLKFYAYHKMDTEIRKGDFQFDGLSKIYCIGILGFNLLEGKSHHTVACLRDDSGQIIDQKMTFILVELEKFRKKPENCTSDLDKLIFTMKEAHKTSPSGEQPAFMKEDWIASALHELDTRGMSPDRRAALSIAVAKELSERHRVEKAFTEAETAKIKVKEAMNEVKTAKSEAKTAKIEAKIAKTEARTAKIEVKTVKAEIKIVKEEVKAAKEETQKQIIKNLIINLGLTDAQIIENLQLSLALVKQVRSEIQGKK
ncbi:MAG: Rpn family recombination-promoting nuclease/putative transposase [Phycisphaerae bacterium]|nr:Rpn family recombination-promoting nuclease/putative transposase [Saprospiraceae bacterium]